MPRRCTPLLRIALLVAVAGLSACADNPLQPLIQGSLSMDVDGQPWTAVSVGALNNGGIVSTSAVDLQGVGFSFAFMGTTPGTYTIGANTTNNASYAEGSNGWVASSAGGSGTMTITTLNSQRVVGTFSFSVNAVGSHTPATVNITNGVFDIAF